MPGEISSGVTVPGVSLVLGGVRSGKSRYAEELIGGAPPPWVYVATGQAFDDEMRARIAEHQARRDERWRTVEAPIELGPVLEGMGDVPVLVDCLTLWLTNVMLGACDIEAAIVALEAALRARRAAIVLVASEVGLGIVPENALARRFRDAAGLLNQRVARLADRVVFMVAGMPLVVK